MNDAVIVSKYLNHIKYKNHLLEFIEKDDGIPYDDKNDIYLKQITLIKNFLLMKILIIYLKLNLQII